MPIIRVPLKRDDTGTNVRELHKQLLAVGAAIDSGEQTGGNFGPTTVAAVLAFRLQYGLPAGETLDASTGRLMHVASAFDGGGRHAALLAAVREAAAADTSEPQELYQHARYAILAGDYRLAHSIAKRIPNHPDVVGVLDAILELPDQQPRRPELPHPENFYTYRYDLVKRDLLEELLRSADSGTTFRARKLPTGPDGDNDFPPDLPDPPEPPDDPGASIEELRMAAVVEAGRSWLEAADEWRKGNEHYKQRRYAPAAGAYEASQRAALRYFEKFYKLNLGAGSAPDRMTSLVQQLFTRRAEWPHLWQILQKRRLLLSLQELHTLDWEWFSHLAEELLRKYVGGNTQDDDVDKANRQIVLDRPMLILAAVFVPLARAEANRARRQFVVASADLSGVVTQFRVRVPFTGDPNRFRPVSFTCDFIERPFAQVLKAETLLDQADAEYKARTPAAEPPAPDVTLFQDLRAAQTYLAIKDLFRNEGAYVSLVETAAAEMTGAIQERLAENDTGSEQFQLVGKNINVPTLTSSGTTLPGLDRRAKAHEPLLKIKEGPTVMRETNPRVYAALLTATARLEQMRAGFNYLGYLDSYVPPWRFQFLLERARYFAEHAKNAQREYLNFLGNAEREEFQELSTSQNVEMEKSNVRMETARVDQVGLEVAAAQQSKELAELTAADARRRSSQYRKFDRYADSLFGTDGLGLPRVLGALGNAPGGSLLTTFGDFFTGGLFSSQKHALLADAQREVELLNLSLARDEALKAAGVARAQLAAATAGLAVAGLQRQAALLRHEFAIQNLQFLRNRTLNAEQWYRLVAAIRSVSETYLRYSIELAFLAEQAYEFEADKPINVIRFDYDLSEVGDFLAADFLLRDLDTLEQDLIVTQRQREQQVRYVLSMAHEFPEALQEIRDSGRTSFSLRLEQIEKRFPGLFNLRIGAVDVLPVALMDSTRFSLELTHLGTSQVRLKLQPDTPPGVPSPSPLNTNDLPVPATGWLAELQETFPVKVRVTGPETAVFSGLSRQDANAVFAFTTAGQRRAFESLGVAAAWQVDFTARGNQVVPGTLADLLFTFSLSGYHDPELRRAINTAPRETTAATLSLSGRTTFPNALYEFNRSGRMAWNITRDLLTLTDTLGALRNVAVLLLPAPGRAHYFGSVMSRYEVQLRITKTGVLEVRSEIPKVTFTLGGAANPLSLTAEATLPPGADISWDFGDGSARQPGADQQHTYAKSGGYKVTLRVVRNGRLSEFCADVAVSRSHAGELRPPVTAFPTIRRETGAGIPDGHTRVVGTVNGPAGDAVIANWRVGDQGGQKGDNATFDLKPGDYTLFFTAVRLLKARVYCTQRHLPGPLFDFNGLSLASNRRFDLDGVQITGTGENPPANSLATHLFAEGALSPVDEWSVELPLAENAFLRSVTATDVQQYGLAEIQDVVLALEYETTPGGPSS